MKKFICLLFCLFLLPFTACNTESEELATYEITAKLNQDMSVDCQMSYTFTNQVKDLSAIYFTLYPNAFSSEAEVRPVFESEKTFAYPNGESYGGVEIVKVTDDSKSLPYEISGKNEQTLKVGFEKSLKQGETKKIYIKFKVTLPNVKHRFGYADNTVNLTGFYPVACVYENDKYYENVYYPAGDPFYSQVANYKVNLTVPSSYSVASSMQAEKTEWSGDETKYYYNRDNVRDIAFVLSEKFNVIENEYGNVTVKYYYFNDKNPEKTLDVAGQSLTFFSENYFKYPYSEYVVAEGDFLYGGMEYPCLSLISCTVEGSERDYTVAHETAHQWFYGIIGVNQNEIGFLDEGLTEYSTVFYLSQQKNAEKSYSKYIQEAKSTYLNLRQALIYSGNTLPPIMNRHLKDFKSNLEYVMIAYDRSLIMIDEIKTELGDKKFNKFLKEFVCKNAYKNVTVKDFSQALEKKSKRASDKFNSFVNGEAVIKAD